MKQKRGDESVLYPTPAVLAGATGNGKPNFITTAPVGIMPHSHVSLGMNKVHYTNQGIRDSCIIAIRLLTCFCHLLKLPDSHLNFHSRFCSLSVTGLIFFNGLITANN